MARAKQAVPFVTSAHLRNFRSVAEARVNLTRLTVLVGLNASGKSNFLDAFRFVAQAFASGLAQAVADRGGVPSVWHQPPSGSSPGELTVDLELRTGGTRYFGPESISDGTLSAAGLLAALFQPGTLEGRIPLVGVKEPALGLHPTAAGALFDALTEASKHVQVIAAAQGGDLLDREDFNVEWARVVEMRDGVTTIGELDEGSRQAVGRGLATLGDLMRCNQLTPRPNPLNVRGPS